jgi:hypothetical protein
MTRKREALRCGLFVLILLAAGCSDQAPTSPTSSASSFDITPANGTTGVRLDATVRVDFHRAVDPMMAQGGMHLIAESDMDSLCPYTTEHHDDMDSVMHDPDMMHHLDEYHSTMGHYAWNSDGTVCTFHPDSLMHSGTRYMVHLSGDMLHHMMGMGSGATMMGGAYTNSAGDMMTHFQTTAARP